LPPIADHCSAWALGRKAHFLQFYFLRFFIAYLVFVLSDVANKESARRVCGKSKNAKSKTGKSEDAKSWATPL
jgi:hypothetical protein